MFDSTFCCLVRARTHTQTHPPLHSSPPVLSGYWLCTCSSPRLCGVTLSLCVFACGGVHVCLLVGEGSLPNANFPHPLDSPMIPTHAHRESHTQACAHLFTKLQMMCRPAAFSSLWRWVLLPNARQPESHLLLSLSPQQYCRSLPDNQQTTRGQPRVAQGRIIRNGGEKDGLCYK